MSKYALQMSCCCVQEAGQHARPLGLAAPGTVGADEASEEGA